MSRNSDPSFLVGKDIRTNNPIRKIKDTFPCLKNFNNEPGGDGGKMD